MKIFLHNISRICQQNQVKFFVKIFLQNISRICQNQVKIFLKMFLRNISHIRQQNQVKLFLHATSHHMPNSLFVSTKPGQITSDKLKPNETMETRSNIRTIKSRQSFPLKQRNVDLPDQEPLQVDYYDNIS